MGLMGTLAKVAIGYAAARGVDKMTRGPGGGLLGGGAQIKGTNPTSHTQAQIADQMSDGSVPAGSNPMQTIMDKMKENGIDLSSIMGGGASGSNPLAGLMGGGASGSNPLAGLMQSMMGGAGAGTDAPKGGLLSSASSSEGPMAGMMGALGGAAAMQGKGVSALMDQFNSSESAPDAEASAALMLRAMIQAAKADGGIDAAEKAKIMETIGDDASAEDMAFVEKQLKAPVDAEALAADVPSAQRMAVYSASLMTIRVDSEAEAQYLHSLARAMELDEPTVNMLHLQMGLKPLYK